MGRDKFENEELIKFGWQEDIWFHVDNYSSAHVYVRVPKGKTVEYLTEAVIEEMAQLTKANSIQGNKVNNVKVVYTPWSNLKKTQGMDVGQVGFHSDKQVRVTRVEKRNNEIVNRLNKTKVERQVDFQAEKLARDRADRSDQKRVALVQQQQERESIEAKKRESDILNYVGFMSEDRMVSNRQYENTDWRAVEDDFM